MSTKPIKSPSPDRSPANAIANTRSPGLQEIKKQITPIKEEATALKILQKIEHREKYTPADTPKHRESATSDGRQESHHRYSQELPAEEESTVQRGESTAAKEEGRSRYQGEWRTQPRA